MSGENSSAPVCDTVKEEEFYKSFNQISFIPALVIVMIFMFMRKRTKLKKDFLDGRPGIQIPVDFLGEEENRFSYAAAYGGMALAVTNMFLGGSSKTLITIQGSPFVKVFQNLVTVMGIGTIYLPFFVCLSTDAKLLGAILGFMYTVGRTVGLILNMAICPTDIYSTFVYWPTFTSLPAVLCHGFLLVRYIVIFVMQVREKCIKKKFSRHDLLGDECEFNIGQHYVDHVKTLLQGVPKINEGTKWYVKGRNFVYTPEPHFKYSVAILSTVIVSGIIIYELLIIAGGVFVSLFVQLKSALEMNKFHLMIVYGEEAVTLMLRLMDIGIVSFLVSAVVSALFTYFQMYRMLISHRRHVEKLIKGDRTFLPNKVNEPHAMVGMSLRFAGYQIAYFIWGFIILMFVLLILSVGIAAAILFLPMVFEGDELSRQVSATALAFIPTIGMAILIFLLQQVLARFVFKERSIDSKVVSIDNRRLYLLLSFFFFFLNILVGLMSCLLRILKGMILGVLFIGRIDRPLIMKGFTNLDGAYVAYIGFLHLQVAHKHPVVRVFSHLLWSGMRRKQQQRLRSSVVNVIGQDNDGIANGWIELKEQSPARPRVSASALNRWFIAVTMIRNPTLIYNRKGFLKHILLGIPNSPTLSRPEEQQPSSSPNDIVVHNGLTKENEHGTNDKIIVV